MRFQRNTCAPFVYETLTGSLGALFFLVTFAPRGCGQSAPYVGAMGGISVLSADAGSQTRSTGLSLSSYAPANGGALDLFAGVNTHKYLTLQLDYIRNSNDLRLNSASSNSATFYQEDRKSSQQAVMFNAMIYFRRSDSRIRPYLGTGVGVVHLSSRAASWLHQEALPSCLLPNSPRPVQLSAHMSESICGSLAGWIFATVSATRLGAMKSANIFLPRVRADWRISKTCLVLLYGSAAEPQPSG